MMEKIKEIFSGYKNLLFDKYKKMAQRRLVVCRGDESLGIPKCSLFTDETVVGGICNPTATENGIAGCGCYLPAKARSIFPETADGQIIGGCPLKKWNGIPQSLDTDDSK